MVEVGAARGCVPSEERLLVSAVRLIIYCKRSGGSGHDSDPEEEPGALVGRLDAGLVPGIFALGDRLGARNGKPPASTASLSHCSHASSIIVDVSPASLWATAARSLALSASPTLWSSMSDSSSISSSTPFSCSSPCIMSSISSTSALWGSALLTMRSSGSTQSSISSAVVSLITMPCSFSKRSLAERVPSHLVKVAISFGVKRSSSKARKRRRCHV